MNVKKVLFNTGDLFLPKKVNIFLRSYIIGNDNSYFYLNYWSMVHFMSGIIFGFLIDKYLLTPESNKLINNYYFKAFILHTYWELWQIFIENTDITTTRGTVDTIVDTVFFMSGVVLFKTCLKRV